MTVLTHPAPAEGTQHKSAALVQPGPGHISYSQLKTYSSCPLAWKLSRSRQPDYVPAALVFGSAFHAAAQGFYQGRLEGREPAQAELMAAYDRVWEEALSGRDGKPAAPIRYPARTDNPAAMRELAERMLGVFLVQVRARPSEIIAVEEEFAVELSPDLPVLKGRIDLIEIVSDLEGRRLNLVDIKTSAKRIDLADVDRDQLGLYAIAARKTGLLEQFDLPLTLGVLAVTKTRASEAIRLGLQPDRDGDGRAIAKARAVWRAMSLGICYPAPGWQCGNCGYSRLCAKWPETE